MDMFTLADMLQHYSNIDNNLDLTTYISYCRNNQLLLTIIEQMKTVKKQHWYIQFVINTFQIDMDFIGFSHITKFFSVY